MNQTVSADHAVENCSAENGFTADPYVRAAEFYDLLAGPQWQQRGPAIAEALQSVAVSSGPVLDIGAGTGPCVEVIARALPQAQIIAIEPSPAMRAALTSRLLAQPDLQQRVTVQPRMLQQVTLPPQLAAVVCCGVIGYFDSATRQQFWHDWASRLAPGGVVIADVMMIDRPQFVPRMPVASMMIGEHEYQIWIQGEPADAERQHWTLEYRILAGTELLDSFAAEHDWYAFGMEQLAAEAAGAGFEGQRLGDALIPAAAFRLTNQ